MSQQSQLVEIIVRPDWRDLTQQAVAERLRTWRAVQIGMSGATLILLLARLAFPSSSWHALLRLSLFAVLFWTLPLWAVLRSQLGVQVALERSQKPFLLLLVAIAVAYVTKPYPDASGLATWLPLLALLIPCLTWPILRQTRRGFPIQSMRLGLVTERWAGNLAIGVLAGCALGLHLLLTARFVPGLPRPSGPAGLWLVWTFGYQAGLMGLGQELLLRGLGYDAAVAGARVFAVAAAKLVLLNLLFYLTGLITLSPTLDALGAAWLLAYGATLAVVATFLRLRQQSLLPGLAASVVFSLFAVSLLGP